MIDSKEKTPIEYLLALSSVKGLDNKRIKRLREHFSSVKAIFDAKPAEIQKIRSFSLTLATQISTVVRDLSIFQEKLGTLRDQNIHVLSFEDTDYPARLKTVPDAPMILCRVGELTEIGESCVAIVGTREPTSEASQLTHGLATKLTSAGFTVVSGLAAGIDTWAHKGALECLGNTIAVLGTDVLTVYPPKNRNLAANIQAHGCLLSEHPFPTSPTPRNLVQRNRIICGLSLATIVIQAKERSGSLHTARFAKEQGRLLVACYWEDDSRSEGTRVLIRDDAIPFTPNGIDDVVNMLKETSKDTVIQGTQNRDSTHEQSYGDMAQTELPFKDAVPEKQLRIDTTDT